MSPEHCAHCLMISYIKDVLGVSHGQKWSWLWNWLPPVHPVHGYLLSLALHRACLEQPPAWLMIECTVVFHSCLYKGKIKQHVPAGRNRHVSRRLVGFNSRAWCSPDSSFLTQRERNMEQITRRRCRNVPRRRCLLISSVFTRGVGLASVWAVRLLCIINTSAAEG